MPEARQEPTTERQRSVNAATAFISLLHARERSDRGKAIAARAELKQLGVVVRFAAPTPAVEGAVENV